MLEMTCRCSYHFLRLTGFSGKDRSKNNIPGSRKKCQMRLIKVLPIHFCNHIAIKKRETLWSFNFLSAKGLMNLCSCKHTYYFLGLIDFPGNGARSENNIPGSRKKCQMRFIKVLPIHFCNHIAIKKAKLYGVFAFSNAIGLTLNAPIATKSSSAFLIC